MKYDHEMNLKRKRTSISDSFGYPYFLRSISKRRTLRYSTYGEYTDIGGVDGEGNMIYDMSYYMMLFNYHNVICFEL